MQYYHLDFQALQAFCGKVFQEYGFTEEEGRQIADVLLAANLLPAYLESQAF